MIIPHSRPNLSRIVDKNNQERQNRNMSLDTEVKELLDNLVNNKIVPGAVFGAIDKNGKFLTNVSSGVQNAETGEPVRENKHLLKCTTKAITCMAVLQAVENGLLDLDEPISKVLPEFLNKMVLKEDGTFENPKQPVTLRHLLTHTSGLVYAHLLPQINIWAKKNGVSVNFNYGRLKDLDIPLGFHPGEKWMYGLGIDWACIALERVTGRTLGQYCKDNVFDPLQSDATFKFPQRNVSRVHAQDSKSKTGFVTLPYTPAIKSPEMDLGGGGMFASVEGYLKLLVPLINNGKGANGIQILKPETVQNFVYASHTKNEPLKGMSDAEGNFGFAHFPKSFGPITHSLLGGINKQPLNNGRSANSAFWWGVGNLYWSVDPSSGIATYFATHRIPFGNEDIVAAALAAEGLVYKHLTKNHL